MDTSARYMSGTDAFAWYMERDPVLRSTAIATFWLDQAPDWEALVERIDRMSRQMPTMRRRVVEPPLRLAPPRWVVAEDFDLHWHLRRVVAPEPGTREVALEIIRQSAMGAFDKARPMWEMTLVEGLADGGAVAVFKVHHSMSDGVGGVAMLSLLFDLTEELPDAEPLPAPPEPEPITGRSLATDALGTSVGRWARLAGRGVRAAVPTTVRTLRAPIATARNAATMATSVVRFTAPIPQTLSPVMRERALTRHLEIMEVPLEDLRRTAKVVEASINDLFLAAITGGLRRYHEHHGAGVDRLRLVMPINMRAEGDTSWGNLITLQRVTLPVSEADARTRIAEIRSTIDVARDEPSLPYTEQMADGLSMLPSGFVGGMLKHVDFLASNVPGSPVPIYLSGAKVTAFAAFGPTIGTSFNVTLISHEGTCNLGFNIDTAAVPDHEVLLRCIEESFEEVIALGRPEVAVS